MIRYPLSAAGPFRLERWHFPFLFVDRRDGEDVEHRGE
jgi:hypothetical protein